MFCKTDVPGSHIANVGRRSNARPGTQGRGTPGAGEEAQEEGLAVAIRLFVDCFPVTAYRATVPVIPKRSREQERGKGEKKRFDHQAA